MFDPVPDYDFGVESYAELNLVEFLYLKLRDYIQISPVILSEFKQIN